MVEIVGVRFKISGKIYSFSPGGRRFKRGDKVIVETSRGVEHGEVAMPNYENQGDKLASDLKPILRLATAADIRRINENIEKREEALKVCREKIAEHKLDMKLVDAEYTFDGKKVLFYFTSDGRVDFRELVKDLAAVFRMRIELRQIGVRDEAKMIGGFGFCGRELCCKGFLADFHSVSISMAKEQGLSLNPTKISGACGRLMCCLKYEQDVYEELMSITPEPGMKLRYGKEKATVTSANILTGMVGIRLEKDGDSTPILVHRSELNYRKQKPKGKGGRGDNFEGTKE